VTQQHPKTQNDSLFDKVNFYYVRDDKHTPIGCVSIGVKDNIYCRGISICSIKEKKFIFQKAVHKAIGRMTKAFIRKENVSFIEPNDRLPDADDSINRFFVFADDLTTRDPVFKGQYNVTLTEFEEKCLDKVFPKKEKDEVKI